MLKEYFYETDLNQEMIDSTIGAEHKSMIDISNHKLMLTKLFQS